MNALQKAEGTPISTFFIYTPKGLDSPLDLKTGTTAALRSEDVQILEREFPHGGTISSVHSPDTAVHWVEAHYDDPLLKSMRICSIGGPIASMLSPDIPALAIFGSVVEESVVQAAQLLADASRFMVILRPITEDPCLKWKDNAKDVGYTKNYTQEHEDTVDSDDSGTDTRGDVEKPERGLNGVLRLRGGAGELEDEYSPWFGPVHSYSLGVTLHGGDGVDSYVSLVGRVQFQVQTMFTDKQRSSVRPQIISLTRFKVKPNDRGVFTDRSYSTSGFLAYGQDIIDMANIPCEKFTPPGQTTKITHTNTDQNTTTGTFVAGINPTTSVAIAKNKIKAKAVENANDKVPDGKKTKMAKIRRNHSTPWYSAISRNWRRMGNNIQWKWNFLLE
ncbi:hypothetical protein C8J57DRAFT_630639 [Mycena rebaudengoi]|nr:hypothetical protein C8J57DRAFT_630639 [Mycena rebaudengoi]